MAAAALSRAMPLSTGEAAVPAQATAATAKATLALSAMPFLNLTRPSSQECRVRVVLWLNANPQQSLRIAGHKGVHLNVGQYRHVLKWVGWSPMSMAAHSHHVISFKSQVAGSHCGCVWGMQEVRDALAALHGEPTAVQQLGERKFGKDGAGITVDKPLQHTVLDSLVRSPSRGLRVEV